jgi:amino acid adenylation domain-containing protein
VTTGSTATLLDGFLRAAAAHPERPALEVAGEVLRYGDLAERAQVLAAAILDREPHGAPPLTAVYAARSSAAYAGVLGALWAGHGYVPLHPGFPPDRLADMLRRSGAPVLIVDRERAALVGELVEGLEEPPIVIDAEATIAACAGRADPVPPAAGLAAIAYLLFTSGSTGRPKGVGVTHANVTSFLAAIGERYGFGPADRFSQTFDLTFDLSVFDQFVTWDAGGCLCVPSEAQLMSPARFIRDSELSVWFSVPSLGAMMRKLRMLKPDAFPTLRASLFCGEPLPVELARAWAAAAPSSTVENLYGPTEATIACTVQPFDPADGSGAAELNGVVAIGEAFGGTRTLVVGADLREVAPGEEGELLLTGPQVTPGYWLDPEKTAAAFVHPPGADPVHYRTGDRVRRPLAAGEPILYLGRMDHQIKVMGHRVELGEIEAVMREASGVDAAIAVGWPLTDSGAGGIAVFIADPDADVAALREAMAERLPDYMVPRRFELLEELPLNANGKFDRRAMLASLEAGDPLSAART